MKSTDIPTLYAQAIERDERGDFKNIDARDRLADVAGEMVNLRWVENPKRLSRSEPPFDHHGWYSTDDKGGSRLWQFHGRHAPLVSLDCAATVEMPEGVYIEWYGGELGVAVLSGDSRFEIFHYTNPADRAAAETASRVYAVLKERESR